MNQRLLFPGCPEAIPAAPAAEQQAHLELVGDKIEGAILDFFAGRPIGFQFHAEDLLRFVGQSVDVSPDSPSRILRHLRRAGRLNYRVINRAGSLYEFLGGLQ